MATEIGVAAYNYWRQQTLSGASSPWSGYFILNNNDYNSIPAWVAASMEGALAGYAANMQGLNEPTINKETNTMWAALIGALTIAAGKVVFGWIPRIQPETITSSTMPAKAINVSSVEKLSEENIRFISGGQNTIIGYVAGTSSSSGDICCDGTCSCQTHPTSTYQANIGAIVVKGLRL